MEAAKFIAIMDIAEAMKNNTRHSWTSSNRHESVAEHSWRLALMSYFIRDEFPDADMNKVMLMTILHDMGEAFTGDIPTFEKTKKDEHTENNEIEKWISTLPSEYMNDLKSLFKEMNELKTPEAKIYKALDKLEAVIQHNEADISTWLPLEYDLQLTYGDAETKFSDYMGMLREFVRNQSLEKIKKSRKN